MKSRYFKLEELVPQNLHTVIHEDFLWGMLDEGLIEAIDTLKEKFPKGSITINNWLWGGDRGWSGIRTIGSPWYSKGSQHSVGKAFDMVFSEYGADEVRKYILDNRQEFPGITRMETFEGMGWVHIDSKTTGLDSIYVFHP